jgi:hypothetical protein
MIRNFAMLADVHGVLPVLDVVLAAPRCAADRIVVCGDLAAGPQSVEVSVSYGETSGHGRAGRATIALRLLLPPFTA